MPGFGDRLRGEREARRRSIEQISAATGIYQAYIEALENEEFHVLPGRAFGKLYIRACAEALGFDPRPLIEEYDRARAAAHGGAPASAADERGGPRRAAAAIEIWRQTMMGERQKARSRAAPQSSEPAGGVEPPEATASAAGSPPAGPSAAGRLDAGSLGGDGLNAGPLREEPLNGGPLDAMGLDGEPLDGEPFDAMGLNGEPLDGDRRRDGAPGPGLADAAISDAASPASAVPDASLDDAASPGAVLPDAARHDHASSAAALSDAALFEDLDCEEAPGPSLQEAARAGWTRAAMAALIFVGLFGVSATVYFTFLRRPVEASDLSVPTPAARPAAGAAARPTASTAAPPPASAAGRPGAAAAAPPSSTVADSVAGPLAIKSPAGTRLPAIEAPAAGVPPAIETPAGAARRPRSSAPPAPPAGPSPLSIPESGLGRRVAQRRLIEPSGSFPEGSVVSFFTRVVGGEPGGRIRHVWIREGRTMQSIVLRIGGRDWRTHSRKTVYGAGRWAVEARDDSGRVLARAEFTCGPESS